MGYFKSERINQAITDDIVDRLFRDRPGVRVPAWVNAIDLKCVTVSKEIALYMKNEPVK